LTLQEDPNRFTRVIPKPPQLHKEEIETEKPKPFQIPPFQSPDVDQLAIDPSDFPISSSLIEGIGMPNKEDYYEMVRLRIDRQKKYPEEAVSMHKQGTVVLSFVINLEGIMRNLKIVKPSPHEVLNQAALQAVRDSNPFMRPSPRLFKEDILIELDVNFELL
jgi:protein TonB